MADVDALRCATERCYAACLRCLSMYADVDIVGLMDSSVDRSQMRFHGGPDMWNSLVERYLPPPPTRAPPALCCVLCMYPCMWSTKYGSGLHMHEYMHEWGDAGGHGDETCVACAAC